MPIRTTAGAVKAVLLDNYNVLSNPSLDPFMEAASAVVDTLKTTAAATGYVFLFSRLELIERWLACHFYSVTDRGYSSRSTDKASGSFDGRTAMGLDFTPYGQQARALDPTGLLASVMSGRYASAAWLGKTLSEQLEYDDRN